MKRGLRFGAVCALLLALAAAGCDDEATCDNDERFERGVCFKLVPDAKPKFGDPCTYPDHGACAGDVVNVCVAGAVSQLAQDYCSASDCNTKPADFCPTGYECWDASQAAPGFPFICRKKP